MLGYIRGRPARPSSPGWLVLKTLYQTVVFWTIFLFLIPAALFVLEERAGLGFLRFRSALSVWSGATVFVLGGSLGLTSGLVMAVIGRGTPLPSDCSRRLVIIGPYRYIRNPMAVAGLTQGVAVGVFLGSPAVVVYAVLGGPVWHLLVRPWEESDLERRFEEPYRSYRAAVRCWIPRLSGYRQESEGSGRTAKQHED
ncbi:MAG: isoprenylcysteine carboxylmethyltransferase family protein [Isosphaeraceae bacterium]|nr:isoprenylcysteine carboxylmethyltransferase family protein [Isosphaeraceae bacterium]